MAVPGRGASRPPLQKHHQDKQQRPWALTAEAQGSAWRHVALTPRLHSQLRKGDPCAHEEAGAGDKMKPAFMPSTQDD